MTGTLETRTLLEHQFESSVWAIQNLFADKKYDKLREGTEKVKALVQAYVAMPGINQTPVITLEIIYKHVTGNPNFSFSQP